MVFSVFKRKEIMLDFREKRWCYSVFKGCNMQASETYRKYMVSAGGHEN